MTTPEILKKELKSCIVMGVDITSALIAEKPDKDFSFQIEYQQFYSTALRLLEILGRDRLIEFRSYYEIDPKRKRMGYGSYAIQDYIKGLVPLPNIEPSFDAPRQIWTAIYNQVTILKSLDSRIEGVLSDITGGVRAQFQDAELDTARSLMKTSLRAAGALAGVVLEGHLQGVALSHAVPITKKHPTIADLNDPLKGASIYPTESWRKISYLADLRNICCHKKGDEPTKEQTQELIDGVNWAVKNIM